MARLNLVVVRARDAARLADFYARLGLAFEKHRHGSGPEHFASENAGCVFEIYPLRPDAGPTQELRLGFAVNDLRQTMERLADAGAEIVTAPAESPWGLRAVIKDIEGHKVELTESSATGSTGA